VTLEDASHLILEVLLVVGRSEHPADVKPLTLRELACRLASSICVKDLLHRVKYVAGVLCGNHVCQSTILVYRGDYLGDLGFQGCLGILYLVDSLIAFFGNVG
jgi:hypothetical protein